MTSLDVLEFFRVAASVGDYSQTEAGRNFLTSMAPITDAEELNREKGYVQRALSLLEEGVLAPSGSVLTLSPLFDVVEREGAQLDPEGLAEVGKFLDYAREIITFCRYDEDGHLSALIGDVAVPAALHSDIRRYITDEGTVNEEAIPEIRRLKQRAGEVGRALLKRSEALIRSAPTMYHGDQPTVRDGRTVIPLAVNFKGRIDGIVHESSASGETLFVEPRELVDLNNELTQTSYAVHQEIRRVLMRLSEEIRSDLPLLRLLYKRTVRLDALIARARWGYRTGGAMVEISTSLDLRNARHPLLGKNCVPLSIKFEEGVQLLVVSGPNTGGKTVLIKTVGLLSALHQCAVPIPADPDSTLPLFDYWGVDIGDEQSIDEQLSTFSAHMRSIAAIVDRAGPASLVLLDELGSGTDPDEGGALSLAIVDTLIERGCTILVSTHQTVLKHYGYTRDAARNVSMDFDQDTHRPTYRIVAGRPGSSHALETAEEQGLDPAVLAAARRYASDRQNSVSDIINRLLEQERTLAERLDNLNSREGTLAAREEELAVREKDLREQEATVRKGYLHDLDRTIREARRAVEGEIRRLREQGVTLDKEEIRAAHRQLDNLASTRDDIQEDLNEGVPASNDAEDFLPEMSVIHRRTGREGVVKSVQEGRVVVQFGGLRMTVGPEEIRQAKKKEAAVRFSTQLSKSTAVLELDLRGKRLQEALSELEVQVDGAVLQGLRSFSVIHGTGTGVLQKGVHDYLTHRPEVATFSFARPEDGGFGKTTVELSQASS